MASERGSVIQVNLRLELDLYGLFDGVYFAKYLTGWGEIGDQMDLPDIIGSDSLRMEGPARYEITQDFRARTGCCS